VTVAKVQQLIDNGSHSEQWSRREGDASATATSTTTTHAPTATSTTTTTSSFWACPEQGSYEFLNFPLPIDEKREQCGTIEEGVQFWNATVLRTLHHVSSPHMCCSACEGLPGCVAWTWGRRRDCPWFTDACWLKALGEDGRLHRSNDPTVVSGRPSKKVRKHGMVPPRRVVRDKWDGLTPRHVEQWGVSRKSYDAKGRQFFGKCPGAVHMEGHGQISMISTGASDPGNPSGQVELLGGDAVIAHLPGRAYFGDQCKEGGYDSASYASIQFLGKTFRYTVDLSGAGCGCNAALYFTNMRQNSQIGTCGDYYCDAMRICGTSCAEIDVQEANQYAWFSTLHTYNRSTGAVDPFGAGGGFGGGKSQPMRRDWTAEEYGPGSSCIDTSKPFQVAASFHVASEKEELEALVVRLSQVAAGRSCSVSSHTSAYEIWGRRPMTELTEALQAGMTPVISYWSSNDMLWLDGLGSDGRGPCVVDNATYCAEHVRFYDFSVESISSASAE